MDIIVVCKNSQKRRCISVFGSERLLAGGYKLRYFSVCSYGEGLTMNIDSGYASFEGENEDMTDELDMKLLKDLGVGIALSKAKHVKLNSVKRKKMKRMIEIFKHG